jgi:hypothetical protein
MQINGRFAKGVTVLFAWNQSRHASNRSSNRDFGIGAQRSTPRIRVDTYRPPLASLRLALRRSRALSRLV